MIRYYINKKLNFILDDKKKIVTINHSSSTGTIEKFSTNNYDLNNILGIDIHVDSKTGFYINLGYIDKNKTVKKNKFIIGSATDSNIGMAKLFVLKIKGLIKKWTRQ